MMRRKKVSKKPIFDDSGRPLYDEKDIRIKHSNCLRPPGYFKVASGWAHISCKQPRLCPACARVYKNQLLDRVKGFFADDTVRFMTLTMRIKKDNSNLDYQNGRIMSCWNILLTDLKRMYPGIRGWLMKEYTRRGALHIHALVTSYIDIWWLKRRWHEITGDSYECWMEEAFEVKNAAAYMMKYMLKQLASFGHFKKGERAYSFFGARAPAKNLLGFEESVVDVVLERHFNPESNYWHDFYYKPYFEIYGRPGLEYINWATLTEIQKDKVLNLEIEFGYHDEQPLPEMPLRREGDAADSRLLAEWRRLKLEREKRQFVVPSPVISPIDKCQLQFEQAGQLLPGRTLGYKHPSEYVDIRHPRKRNKRIGGKRTGDRPAGPGSPYGPG